MQNHRNLRVWRLAHDLAIAVRRATRTYPQRGHGSLISQTTRAAESVPLTMAEGCGAASNAEFARFLDMSIKSVTELEEQLELAKDYGILHVDLWKRLSDETIALRRQTYSLRTKVRAEPKYAAKPATRDSNSQPETPGNTRK